MALIPFSAGAEQWRDLFKQLGPDLPTDFLIAWLNNESGGNPCAVGMPNREAGIFQTDHPGDDRFGATFAQLRTGCSGGTLVDPSAVNRSLQASHGLNFVRSKRDMAGALLTGVGARWSTSSSDFWKMVKQLHALPCVATELLPKITRKLGRAPANWDEFREAVMAFPVSEMGAGCATFANAPSHHGLRNRIEDTLKNAEDTGKFGGGVLAVLGQMGPVIVAGAAGLLLLVYLRSRRR